MMFFTISAKLSLAPPEKNNFSHWMCSNQNKCILKFTTFKKKKINVNGYIESGTLTKFNGPHSIKEFYLYFACYGNVMKWNIAAIKNKIYSLFVLFQQILVPLWVIVRTSNIYNFSSNHPFICVCWVQFKNNYFLIYWYFNTSPNSEGISLDGWRESTFFFMRLHFLERIEKLFFLCIPQTYTSQISSERKTI